MPERKTDARPRTDAEIAREIVSNFKRNLDESFDDEDWTLSARLVAAGRAEGLAQRHRDVMGRLSNVEKLTNLAAALKCCDRCEKGEAQYCDECLTTAEQRGEASRVAVLTAHRACCGVEHDPANGKLHGCCVVCGVPWPCDYAGQPPARGGR